MKSRALTTIRTVFSIALGIALFIPFESYLKVAAEEQTPDRPWFTSFPPLGTAVDTTELTRYGLTQGNKSSTVMVSALGQICTLSGSGVTSNPIYPFSVTYRGPVNFALGSMSANPSVAPQIFAARATPFDSPMLAIFQPGPPAVHVGDVPMNADMRFGSVLAIGDVTADAAQELFVTPGPGGPPVIYILGASGNDAVSLYPFGQNHQGNFRIALGRFNNSGYDQLVVTQNNGGILKIFEFLPGLVPHEVVSASPFPGLAPEVLQAGGVFPATFDLNGNGNDDIVVSPGSGPPQVRAFSLNGGGGYDPIVIADIKPAGTQANTTGARVAAGLVNGTPSIMTGFEASVAFYKAHADQTPQWVEDLRASPWGQIALLFIDVKTLTAKAPR